MLFDILKDENSRLKDYNNIYRHCIDCEKTVRTHPFNIQMRARTALERFINAVLEINGIKIPEDKDEKKEKGLDSLYDKINVCFENNFIDECHKRDIRNVRLAGNDATHEKDEYEEAADILRSLYVVIASYAMNERITRISDTEVIKYYDKNKEEHVVKQDGYETEDLLPIGDYEVIKPLFAIPDSKNPKPSKSIKMYRCKKTTSFGANNDTQYAIIKKYIKNATDDVTQFRDQLAIHTIKKYYNILEKPPILAEEIETSIDNDYNYLCYLTSEKTFLLSQKNTFRKYIQSRKLKTDNEMFFVKLNILKDIVEILNSLIDITENISLHHRNLRPDCIFLTPTHKGLGVNVGNFEYSKVMDTANMSEEAATININAYAKKVSDDPFASPEVKDASIKKMGTPNWEQVDIYACAKMALYILCGDAANENIHKNLDYISQTLSYDFYEITKKILETPYPSRPTLKEYLKAIKKELIELE
ncbi:MAG: DUF4145 domain-containing protein [Ruminococcaceae bacterium]|nr:DUF4145 domain-containing protein [Oscillospiraceae bacterium]